jgi:hypothetical protein
MYFWKYSKRSIHQTQTIVSSKGVEVEVTEKININHGRISRKDQRGIQARLHQDQIRDNYICPLMNQGYIDNQQHTYNEKKNNQVILVVLVPKEKATATLYLLHLLFSFSFFSHFFDSYYISTIISRLYLFKYLIHVFIVWINFCNFYT